MSANVYLDGKLVKLQEGVPLVALREKVVFPSSWESFSINRDSSKKALDASLASNGLVVFACQKDPQVVSPGADDVYKVGTIARIRRFWKVNGDYNLTVEGLTRVLLTEFVDLETYLAAKVNDMPEFERQESEEREALVVNITSQMNKYRELGGHLSLEASIAIFSAEDANALCNAITAGIEFKAVDKQAVLEMMDEVERLKKVSELLAHEIRVLEIGQKIANQTQEKVKKVTKEAILREQMNAIRKELGEEGEDLGDDLAQLKAQAKEVTLPEDVAKKVEKEIKRLGKMSSMSPESSYIRTYLETILELPWGKKSDNTVDLKGAQKVLDEDHYALGKAKERILEYLAVQKMVGKIKGPILCFYGPPGVGKTSIGRSIAKSLGRKFVKISLGGIRDEAEIRGHRRTYVGALPGRIIQGMKTAGTSNPVFMLDEIDKLGYDYKGDPSAALLEALDPEQNFAFSDHYLEVPFDLSDVFFICTANTLDTIPHALLDRLEIIEFTGYTEFEKFAIARNYLVPKAVESHGLKDGHFTLTDGGLKTVISEYTREAGVRNLEREVSALTRKVARKIAEEEGTSYVVDGVDVKKYLGPTKFTPLLAEKEDAIGISTGLAWTEMGGKILFIEVSVVPGKGQITLTGHLGDVMKESCMAALSYVRSRAATFGLDEKFAQKYDIHVHVPAGAVPKDGPSAGLAITSALVSALTKIPSKRDVAMTGEVTLRGRALEIGGFKEKVIAAHRAGIRTVIAPKENEKDLVDIPDLVKHDPNFKFVFVEHMDEVLPVVLTTKIKPKVVLKKDVEENEEDSDTRTGVVTV